MLNARAVLLTMFLLPGCTGPDDGGQVDDVVSEVVTDSQGTDLAEDAATAFDTPSSRAEFSRLMAEKFDRSQDLLKLVLYGDFIGVAQQAAALDQISLQAEWLRHGPESYALMASDFRDALHEVIRCCEEQDSRGLLQAHGAVSRSCLDCHVQVRRVAKANSEEQ